jgi:D-Tyr-tRNAtyr deacylase
MGMNNDKTNLDKKDMISKYVGHVNGVFSMLITLATNDALPEAAKLDPQGMSWIFEDAQDKMKQIQKMACSVLD